MQEQIGALQKLLDKVIEFVVNYSFQVLGAVIVLVIGAVAANRVSTLILKILEKKKLDITLAKFIASTIKFLILGFAALIALGKFGITIAPFVAALGAAVFGATYAVQGPLSNYGAGLAIILGRPFSVGHTITVAGVSGVVEEVKLGATILTTGDGVRITIPNKHIVGEILYDSGSSQVSQGLVGVSYDGDPEKAIQLVRKVLGQFKEVASHPAPQIGIQSFGDSSVNIGYRYWVPTPQFYETTYAINLAVFRALREAGVEIPFPQCVVHTVSQPAPTR